MAKFTMLIGIAGSGKSHYAKSFSNGRVLSSDGIRQAVLGDRQDQKHNGLIFDIMNRQTKLLLEEGHDVYYDATNISSKRRMALLKTLPEGTEKVAYFFACPLELAIERDKVRDASQKVGEEAITRMYKSLDVPMVYEGFDRIEYVKVEKYDTSRIYHGGYKELSTSVDCTLTSYKRYCESFLSGELKKCIDYAQDNPHHTFSVSKHMYHTMEKFRDGDNDRLTMAAALHDCGKPLCKDYKDDGYACFYGHDKVSAQMAVRFMIESLYMVDDIAYVSTLINLHMRMHQEGGKDKLLKLVGEDMYKELELLHEADSTAK